MTSRPMTEVPECQYCNQPIIGGKGDWWHSRPYGKTEIYCPDGLTTATPKRVPADLSPIIADLKRSISLEERRLEAQKRLLEDYETMWQKENS